MIQQLSGGGLQVHCRHWGSIPVPFGWDPRPNPGTPCPYTTQTPASQLISPPIYKNNWYYMAFWHMTINVVVAVTVCDLMPMVLY